MATLLVVLPKPAGFPPEVVAWEAPSMSGMPAVSTTATDAALMAARPHACVLAFGSSPRLTGSACSDPLFAEMAAATKPMTLMGSISCPAFDASVVTARPPVNLEVMAVVGRLIQKGQVFETVVVSDVVDVMNIESIRDGAVGVLPDLAMFEYAPFLPVNFDGDIDVSRDTTGLAAVPSRVPFTGGARGGTTSFTRLGVVKTVAICPFPTDDGTTAEDAGLRVESSWHAYIVAERKH